MSVCGTLGMSTCAIQCKSEYFFFFCYCMYSKCHYQIHSTDVPSQYLSCTVCKLFFFFFLNLVRAVSNLGLAEKHDVSQGCLQ